MTKIRRGNLYGLRADKYETLNTTDVSDTDWAEIAPQTPFYLFADMDMEAAEEYNNWISLPDILKVNSVGIVTARDKLSIDEDYNELWDRVNVFVESSVESARYAYNLGKDSSSWRIKSAQEDITACGLSKIHIKGIQYRPFDKRYIYYLPNSGGFICRPIFDTMRHMLVKENLGISTTRRVEINDYSHVFCTEDIIQHHTVSLKEVNYLFPLYLYPSASGDELQMEDNGEREPNLSPEFVERFLEAVGAERLENSPEVGMRAPGNTSGKGLKPLVYPEDIFYYIYGVLHSPTYRERYAEFLKIDFPRIPLPKNYDSFNSLATAGQELTRYHLLKDKESWDWGEIGQRGDATDTTVGKVEYDENKQEIVFDIKKPPAEQVRVGPVPPEIWEFHIGGYQVLHKWLKDRKGRKVDLGDYVPIIIALKETNRIMKEEIDPVFRGMIGIE